VWSYNRVGVLKQIADLCAEAEEQGEFKVRDPELTGMMLLGGIRTVLRAGPQPRPADLPSQIVSNLLWGAATPGSANPAVSCRRKANGVPAAIGREAAAR